MLSFAQSPFRTAKPPDVAVRAARPFPSGMRSARLEAEMCVARTETRARVSEENMARELAVGCSTVNGPCKDDDFMLELWET